MAIISVFPTGVAKQLNSSSAEALVACMLSKDAHHFIDAVDEMKKPLKSMVFTNGPAEEVCLVEDFKSRSTCCLGAV